jgi:acyl carrier protein
MAIPHSGTMSLVISTNNSAHQNSMAIVGETSKNPLIESVALDVWNFHTDAYAICHNWLQAHNYQPLDPESTEHYLRLVLLLQDVVAVGEEIKVAFCNNHLKKLGILQTICTIVVSRLGIAADKVIPTANLTADLGIDSLDMLELVIALESTFDIEITDQVAKKLTTVQQMINYISQKVQIGIYQPITSPSEL